MNHQKTTWFVVALLMASMIGCSSAAAAAAVDGKPSQRNSAIAVEEKPIDKESSTRESKDLKSDATYSNYALYGPAPAATAAYHAQADQQVQPYPVPSTSYSDPHETTMGFVYYYLPTVEKYYPKFRDLLPFLKRYTPTFARAWPMMRTAADRTFGITSAIGLLLLAPILVVSVVGFLGFLIFLFLFPAVSAFGRRRIGRDVGDENVYADEHDFDNLLPAHESRRFATLAARVDNMLDGYMRALKSESCLEKVSCEAGQLTNRLGKVASPLIQLIEPYIPTYMTNKFSAFKIGARSGGSDCSLFQCKVPFFSK